MYGLILTNVPQLEHLVKHYESVGGGKGIEETSKNLRERMKAMNEPLRLLLEYTSSKERETSQCSIFEACRGMIGFETETWVPSDHYRKAKSLAELVKLKVLMEIPKGELRDKTEANWFLDDMDEEDYM